MIATLDLSGMAELKPGYKKYHLIVIHEEDGETHINFTTIEYCTFLSFLIDDREILDTEDYMSYEKNNEFHLEVLI